MAPNRVEVTPLHWASWNGHAAAVSALISSAPSSDSVGTLLSAEDCYSTTPLHCAVERDNVKIAELLLQASPGYATVLAGQILENRAFVRQSADTVRPATKGG